MYDALKPGGMSTEVWNFIVEAWENGLSDREAAMRAMRETDFQITPYDIQKMVKENADIAQLKDFLSADITSQARLNIVNEIRDGNVAISKWYLERKAPDEFSSKAAVQFEGAVTPVSIEEKQEEMERFMRQFDE